MSNWHPSDTRALAERIGDLEPDARAVVELIVSRLEGGRSTYGELDLASDPRDFRRELVEELVDAAAYGAADLLRLAK